MLHFNCSYLFLCRCFSIVIRRFAAVVHYEEQSRLACEIKVQFRFVSVQFYWQHRTECMCVCATFWLLRNTKGWLNIRCWNSFFNHRINFSLLKKHDVCSRKSSKELRVWFGFSSQLCQRHSYSKNAKFSFATPVKLPRDGIRSFVKQKSLI